MTGGNKITHRIWDPQAAQASLERWFDMEQREQWQCDDRQAQLLERIFGASWYFTRFLFYRGQPVLDCLELDEQRLQTGALQTQLDFSAESQETAFEQLRLTKNTLMLQIFIGFLNGKLDQQQTELYLTRLAIATLHSALDITFRDSTDRDHFAVLAMGRMAGDEMTFGSDLDLIFLYSGSSSDLFETLSKKIRQFLRLIAMSSPVGNLYQVDTRLRPHGNSGVLITSVDAFAEYHASQSREIWERQIMTRCKPVYGDTDLFDRVYTATRTHVYRVYDLGSLRQEIGCMRQRVEKELGSSRGEFDIKRGPGGIMDIDFITHYLQLAHGRENKQLQTCSTRQALTAIGEAGLLGSDQVTALLHAYDFLKRVESCLRVHDMKSIDSLSEITQANTVTARALGFVSDGVHPAAAHFMRTFRQTTTHVREIFQQIIHLG